MSLPSKLRGAGRVNTDPCGCQYQNCRYIHLCPEHEAEQAKRHTEAQADHERTERERTSNRGS